jgi:ABC-type transport system involved in cytochrome c biogenesis permease subunit
MMAMIRVLALAILSLLAAPSFAAVDNAEALARLLVQDGGRIMPMDSFARLRLLQFSGKSTFHGEPAIGWLGRTMFEPEASASNAIFLINHPELPEALKVPDAEGRRRFSFAELQPGLGKLHEMAVKASEAEEKERTPLESEILRLYENINTYGALMQSFSFTRPHADFAVDDAATRKALDLPEDRSTFSFFEIYQRAPKIAEGIGPAAQTDQAQWTDLQRQLFLLSSSLYRWSQYYAGLPPAVLPIPGHAQEQWISPWDTFSVGSVGEIIRKELQLLNEMSAAWVDGSQAEFDLAAQAFDRSVRARAPESNRGVRHASLELAYNRLDPFYRAELLYGFGFLLSLACMLRESRWMRRIVLVLVLVALVPHTYGLVARMVIMGRPPVTNLFATFIFVGWICVLLGLAIEWFQRNALGLLMATASGLVLLLVSGRFSAQGDTLSVVVAVLDSNFWLATHVVAITIGYAGCVASGVAGHIYLLKAIRRSPDSPDLKGVANGVYGLLAFGLIFSFLGTMLGGVWADQSWGRFWGWDPKENGALLIVLWCSLLFHARIAKLIGPIGFAAGAVLGVIIVLLAWLGVNLLGVGLHSYGFTSGLARGLYLSILAEVLFVGITVPLAKSRATRKP